MRDIRIKLLKFGDKTYRIRYYNGSCRLELNYGKGWEEIAKRNLGNDTLATTSDGMRAYDPERKEIVESEYVDDLLSELYTFYEEGNTPDEVDYTRITRSA